VDIETVLSEDGTSVHSDAESLGIMLPEDIDLTEDEEVDVEVAEPPRKKKQKRAGDSTQARPAKGIDLSLPPLSNMEECMSDMTEKAINLGLDKTARSLNGRCLKVATMCSGTESPLLALDDISRGQSVCATQHSFTDPSNSSREERIPAHPCSAHVLS
jgi:hypothetical protein